MGNSKNLGEKLKKIAVPGPSANIWVVLAGIFYNPIDYNFSQNQIFY